MVQDLATQWIQAYPCKTKTSQETQRSLQKFQEPDRSPTVIYTDNSLEFGKSCEDLSWNHCTSTPHRSETNGIAERAVRRVKEDTSAVLLQSGLDEKWWADSMECCTYLRNVTDLLPDGKTPYERRFGQPFKGPIIPFGIAGENLLLVAPHMYWPFLLTSRRTNAGRFSFPGKVPEYNGKHALVVDCNDDLMREVVSDVSAWSRQVSGTPSRVFFGRGGHQS